MLQRCDHIHLIAQDVERTVDWYCRVLGARVVFEGAFRGSSVRYIEVAGMTFIIFGRLEGETLSEPGPVRPGYGVDHFGFAVDDLSQTIAEIEAAGGNVIEGPLTVRPGLDIAYIEGPDSVRIELTQREV